MVANPDYLPRIASFVPVPHTVAVLLITPVEVGLLRVAILIVLNVPPLLPPLAVEVGDPVQSARVRVELLLLDQVGV